MYKIAKIALPKRIVPNNSPLCQNSYSKDFINLINLNILLLYLGIQYNDTYGRI